MDIMSSNRSSRMIVEVFSQSLIKVWEEGKVRLLVLLSLTLQVILILMGNRRKYISKSWIRIMLWCAYLAADYVATVALGAILSNFVDVYGSNNAATGSENIELTAFWAPFLLLHLGGPDTITAYSLEDNELWTRHLLGLVVQAGVAVYILLMSWTGSFISLLSVLMIFAGLIKYAERTWVLRSASNDQLRVSSVSTLAEHKFGHTNIREKYRLKEEEGYCLRAEWISAVHQLPIYFSDVEDSFISEEDKLVRAYALIEKIKCLLLDVVLSNKDRNTMTAVFRNMPPKNAWEVIDMELGFMYDLLYTKAMVAHIPWGIAFRIISFLLTCISLGIFSSVDLAKHKYSKVDLDITFLLLIVAILLEIYAALVQVSLDQTIVWLVKHKRSTISQAIPTSLSVFRNPKWSNSVGQYSLLSYLVGERVPVSCTRAFRLILKIDKRLKLYRQYAVHHDQVSDDFKKWIFEYLQNVYARAVAEEHSLFTKLCRSRGSIALQAHYRREGILSWSTNELEFEQSILIWHIATEICYHLDHDYFTNEKEQEKMEKEGEETGGDNEKDEHENAHLNREVSMYLSRYMMYLLVMSPKALPPPTGVLGRISLQQTYAEAVASFQSFEPISVDMMVATSKQQKGERTNIIIQACKMLLHKYAKEPESLMEVSDDPYQKREKGWEASLLGKACELSLALGGQDLDTIEGERKEASNTNCLLCHCHFFCCKKEVS